MLLSIFVPLKMTIKLKWDNLRMWSVKVHLLVHIMIKCEDKTFFCLSFVIWILFVDCKYWRCWTEYFNRLEWIFSFTNFIFTTEALYVHFSQIWNTPGSVSFNQLSVVIPGNVQWKNVLFVSSVIVILPLAFGFVNFST